MDQMGTGSAILTLTFVLAAFATGCDDQRPKELARGAAGTPSANTSQTRSFQACQDAPGGYRIRAFGISCPKVRSILAGMFHHAKRITKRKGEAVYRNDNGWTCLSQGQPRRLGYTLILCVKGPRAILYQFS